MNEDPIVEDVDEMDVESTTFEVSDKKHKFASKLVTKSLKSVKVQKKTMNILSPFTKFIQKRQSNIILPKVNLILLYNLLVHLAVKLMNCWILQANVSEMRSRQPHHLKSVLPMFLTLSH